MTLEEIGLVVSSGDNKKLGGAIIACDEYTK